MSIFEILLIGVALSMDAVAVGMTNGMTEPDMKREKSFLVAGMYGLFQFLMPVIGYYCGYAFSAIVEKIAPWLSFALLGAIGGKMIFDFFSEHFKKEKAPLDQKPLGPGKLFLQALATSIDALAVGVALLAAKTSEGLPFHVVFCALSIGGVTFLLSLAAVFAGKKIGNKLADKAGLLGGVILVAIGIKLFVEGLV